MGWLGIWHGGHNYGHGDGPLDGLEWFGSIGAARAEFQDRRELGRGRFAYVVELDSGEVACRPESTGTPVVDDTASLWLFRALGPGAIRALLDSHDPYPDRILRFGARGGVALERC